MTFFSFPVLQYSLLDFNSRKKIPFFDELNEISVIKFDAGKLTF